MKALIFSKPFLSGSDSNSKCSQGESGFSFAGTATTYGSSNKAPTPDKCPSIFLNQIKKEAKNYCKAQNYRKNYLTQLIYYGQSFTGGDLSQGCKTVGLGCCATKKN